MDTHASSLSGIYPLPRNEFCSKMDRACPGRKIKTIAGREKANDETPDLLRL